ncbi:hypothetical protein ASF23_08845 [Curtobacterium sp. Leaf261]|nr:hypothetical protein ASF23_08845 [Curtobacterium sp. Leaf261]
MRHDLQGLRAYAVLIVIATHVWGVPTGGHVTVDMFFVISGFLITGLLLREQSLFGRVSLRAFFGRRVKRLLPAAAVVGALTITFSALMFSAARRNSVLEDGLWSMLLVQNWHLATVQTDYFAADGPVSPFQHYWSLSVEEQFYLFWPVLMVLVFSLIGRSTDAPDSRRSRLARGAVGGLLVAMTLASWAWSLHDSAAAPTTAYFSTLDRAWEIGCGAVIAFGVRCWERVAPRLGVALLWLGVVGLGVSMAVVPETPGFPAPWGTLPVLATGAVLIGGANPAVRVPTFLANRVTDYLGGLSYSLYLCHFPVLVLLRSVDPSVGWLTLPICGALAVSVHHAVEVPRMRGAWFSWSPPAAARLRESFQGTAPFMLIGLATVTILMSAVAIHAVRPRSVPSPPDAAVTTDETRVHDTDVDRDASGGGADMSAVAALQTQLTAALAATSWPTFDPPVERARDEHPTDDCGRLDDPLPLSSCTFGPADASVRMMLVGDSTAAYLADALVTLVKEPSSDVRLMTRTAYGCSFSDLPAGPAVSDECIDFRNTAMDDVEREHPDVLLIVNTYGSIELADKSIMPVATWSKALTTFATRADAAAGTVVHLSPPPPGPDPTECITPGGSPERCVTSSSGAWAARWTAVEFIAERLHQTAIDIRPLVCVVSRCPVFAGNTLIRFDGVHLAPAYARKMAPGLRELLMPVLDQAEAPAEQSDG